MLKNKFSKRVLAGIMAGVMTATASVTSLATLTASAGEELGSVDFNSGVGLPWHICESATGTMSFEIKNNVYNIKITNPGGVGNSGEGRWDCQFRHRGLSLENGHTYRITYSMWTSQRGRFYAKLGNITNDDAEYWHMNGTPLNVTGLTETSTQAEVESALKSASTTGSEIQYYQGWNDWMNSYLEPNKWTTYAYEFKVDFSKMENVSGVINSMNHEGVCEWTFHLGGTTPQFGQNFECFPEGTILKFDNMALIDMTDDKSDYVATEDYTPSGIELNQVGYYPNLTKKATLVCADGDNSAHEFTVKDSSGATVYTGTSSGKAVYDEGAWDYSQILDFSDFTTPGKGYYIECDGKKSLAFDIGDDIYDGLLTNAMSYFYQNRSGVSIDEDLMVKANEYQDAAPADSTRLGHTEYGHNPDKAHIADEWVYIYAEDPASKYPNTIDVTGGWYDAGDHGKYVVNGGVSLWTLMNIYERSVANGDASKWDDNSGTVIIPETGNSTPDILDEVKVETDFFLKMQRADGMVYHKIHDYKWTALAVAPWSEAADLTRIVKPVTFAASLNFAAALAQASRLFEKYDASYASELLTAAEKAYAAAKTNYYPYANEKDPDHSMYAPLDQNKGGGPYGDTEVSDEFYWAACELYITTGKADYKTDLDSYKDAYVVQTNLVGGENNGSCSAFTWGTLSSLGTMSLYLNADTMLKDGKLSQAEVNKISDSIVNAADFFIEKENNSQYGIPYVGHTYSATLWDSETDTMKDVELTNGYEWGSNSMVINNAMVMALAYDVTSDVNYLNGVSTAFDYLLGRNPLEQSYVTGYGEHATTYPHHRWWSYQLDKSFPMAPKGVLSGGPNSNMEDPMVLGAGYKRGEIAPMKCYLDNLEAWSVNECTINWNSPLVWVVSFLEDEAPKAGSHSQTTTKVTTTTVSGETTTTTAKTTTTASGSTTTGKVGDALIGDTNLDGAVSLADLITFQKQQRGAIDFNDQQMINADCDQTDAEGITSSDVSVLLQFLIGKINALPLQ